MIISLIIFSYFLPTVWVKHVNSPFLVDIFVSFPNYSVPTHRSLAHRGEEGVFSLQ